MNCSQKVFYSCENLLGAKSSDILEDAELTRSPKTIDIDLIGKSKYSIACIPLSDSTRQIKSVSVTLSENYSTTKKQITPISQILIFGSDTNSINFLNAFSPDTIADSDLRFNDIVVTSSNIDTLKLKAGNVTNSPQNIFSSKSVYSNTEDINFFYFLPKYTKGQKSILDSMNRIYWFSLMDSFENKNPINLPKSYKYLFIIPFATLPVVPTKTGNSTASIFTSYMINMEVND